MYKTFTRLLLFFVLISNMAAAQPKVEVNVFILDNRKNNALSDTIYYTPDRQLTWTDFKGSPDYKAEAAAVTASGFAYNASVRYSNKVFKLNIFISTFFNKRNSWKKNTISSDYHLRHEQVHFDITRIAAENFRTMLLDVSFTKENYTQLLKHVWLKAQESWHMMQTAYDEETNHSIRKKDQRRWNDFATEEIRKLYPQSTSETVYSKTASHE